MAKDSPRNWSRDKIEQVATSLVGMQRRYNETHDPDLLEGIKKVQSQIAEAEEHILPPDEVGG